MGVCGTAGDGVTFGDVEGGVGFASIVGACGTGTAGFGASGAAGVGASGAAGVGASGFWSGAGSGFFSAGGIDGDGCSLLGGCTSTRGETTTGG